MLNFLTFYRLKNIINRQNAKISPTLPIKSKAIENYKGFNIMQKKTEATCFGFTFKWIVLGP